MGAKLDEVGADETGMEEGLDVTGVKVGGITGTLDGTRVLGDAVGSVVG